MQEKHQALLNENDKIAKTLMEYENWEKTESQNELKEVLRGQYVYAPKTSEKPHEPTYWLCTNCWNRREKSILQAIFHNEYDAIYLCPNCKMGLSLTFKLRRPKRIEPESY